MTGWRLAFVVGSAAAAAIAIACGPGFLEGISGGTPGEQPDSTSIVDGGTSDGPVACVSELPPDRKADDDSPTNLALSFAFDKLRIDSLGESDAGAIPLGLDLDRTCTCPAADSCVRPNGLTPACDGPKGQDNALSALFNQLNVALPVFPATFATERIRSGHFTVLVELRGWNGLPDDPNVIVALRLSQQIDKQAKDGGRPLPRFDGQDLWTVDPSSITGGDTALGQDCRAAESTLTCIANIADSKAYVTGGKLVAHPRVDPTGTLPVPIFVRSSAGQIAFNFVDFTMVATISGPTGGPYRLDGELAGRVDSDSYITSLVNLQDVTQPGTNEPPLCNKPAIVALLKASICGARDMAAPGKDSTGAPCGYLSGAFSFGASPAIAGTVLRKDSFVRPCGDASFGCQ